MALKKEISSIVKAAEVLKRLSAGDSQLSAIARKLEYDKSTVHRILKTLETVGFATQDPVTKHFYPGPLLHSLSSNFMHAHKVLNEIAHNHMRALRDTIEETINLQIPMGAERVIVDVVHMVREFMYYAKQGHSYPLVTGAAGVVLLSMLNEKDLMPFLNKLMLLPPHKESIHKKVLILQNISDVHTKGYAVDDYQTLSSGCALSVPVENYICPLALTTVGLESRLKPNQKEIINELKTTSQKISAELGKIYK